MRDEPKHEELSLGFGRCLWGEKVSGELVLAQNADYLLAAIVADLGVSFEPSALKSHELRTRRATVAVELAGALQQDALSELEMSGFRLAEVLSVEERAIVTAPKDRGLGSRLDDGWTSDMPLFVTREMRVGKPAGEAVVAVHAHAWAMLRLLRAGGLMGDWGML